MGISRASGKTRAERAACDDAGTKVRRLLDTLALLKKSSDELGKLRDEYAGGGLSQLLMLNCWGPYML